MSMSYEEPEIRDYGDLLEITAAAGQVGSEDGAGKVIAGGVPGLAEVTVQLFP